MFNKKKKWYFRWWAIALWIFLGLGIISSFIPDEYLEPTTPQTIVSSSSDDNVVKVQKTLNEMMPSRQDIPTEFSLDPISNYTFREAKDIPKGFNSGVKTKGYKLVGSGIVDISFDIFKFESKDLARKEYNKRKNYMINEGGYTELSIKVPSNAECFSYLEDYGFDARFAVSYCYKDNLEYEVFVTSTQTFDNPKKYLKDMIIILDNSINR